MIQKLKLTLSWIGCSFFAILFLATIGQSISWLFYLGLSALLCPPLMNYLTKRNKIPKLKFRILLGIGLFILGMVFLPTDITNTPANPKGTETVSQAEDTGKNEKSSEKNTSEKTSMSSETNYSEQSQNSKDENDATVASVPASQSASGNNTAASDNNTSSSDQLSNMYVHFIDVGQGDSILVESSGHYMLIDAGENDQGTKVVNYLKEQGVKKLDYVIGTHPHSDHIGGLDTVIQSFSNRSDSNGNYSIGKVILPDVTHNTETFEDVLDAVEVNHLKITKAKVGSKYTLGSSSFTIISPNSSDYDDLNNYSVGIKLTNGSNSFLMAGDAEALSEKEMLSNGIDLSADVIKLGHHGSSYSSNKNFLDAVNPDYAVISVGTGNQYGHPHVETLQEIANRNIKLFRTDKQGTIVFTSDGRKITVNEKPYTITNTDLSGNDKSSTSYQSSGSGTSYQNSGSGNGTPTTSGKTTSKEIIVHITESGSKYHAAGCRYLKTDIKVTLKEALSQGLEPCKVCNPPTSEN